VIVLRLAGGNHAGIGGSQGCGAGIFLAGRFLGFFGEFQEVLGVKCELWLSFWLGWWA